MSEGARDIWVYDTQDASHRQLTTFRGEDRDPVWSPDGNMIYYLSERSGSFNVWRLTKVKFYRPDLHGVDWERYRDAYAKYLPHLYRWEEFAEMLSELAGELNASHMRSYYHPKVTYGDDTASLGLYYDHAHEGPGMRIADVLSGGPATGEGSRLQAGAVILAVDGEPISADMDIYPLLNRKVRVPVQLTIQPVDGSEAVRETVTPIAFAKAMQLAYERWIDQRKALTQQLSNGCIGYFHVSGMDDPSYRRAYSELFGELWDKEAVIVDVRFNRGGNLHDQLIAMLTGEAFSGFTTRDGELIGRMPINRWAKPNAMLANAASYSDGSIFPHLYKKEKIGAFIGEPVPGTGTAVWWMFPIPNRLQYGIPQLGAKDLDGDWFENHETVPDILVRNDPDSIEEGRDLQLERAVEHLLEQLGPLKP
jgi:tricorn protease